MLPPHHSLYKARARAGAGALPSWQPGIPAGRAVAGVQGGSGLALPDGWGSCVREGGEGRRGLLLRVLLLLGPIDDGGIGLYNAMQLSRFLLMRPIGPHIRQQTVQHWSSLSISVC